MAPAPQNPKLPINSTVAMSLAQDATAAVQARRVVRDTLLGWQLPALVDPCVLVVSELVTNAVRHGRPPFGLSVRRRFGNVRIDVNDARPEPVTDLGGSQPDNLAESGRGLCLVRDAADNVGCERVRGDGKNVYASWNVRELSTRAATGAAGHSGREARLGSAPDPS
jgi:anti-sigma regulatory factor (Ser/Thr protein kinase)